MVRGELIVELAAVAVQIVDREGKIIAALNAITYILPLSRKTIVWKISAFTDGCQASDRGGASIDE